MSVVIKRTRESSQSYGRGRDQRYQPAFYDVIKDGKTVGHLMARSVAYMETPTWQVLEIIGGVAREVRTFYREKPFTKAKEWAVEHFSKIETNKLTDDIWETMTPVERNNLRVKALAASSFSDPDSLNVSKHWDEYWGEEKRALIRAFKKESAPIDSRRITRGRTPRITPKTPRLSR